MSDTGEPPGPRPNAILGLVGRIIAGEQSAVVVVTALASCLDDAGVLPAADFGRKLLEYAEDAARDVPDSMLAFQLRAIADSVANLAERIQDARRAGKRPRLRVVTDAPAQDPGRPHETPPDSSEDGDR